MGLLNFSNQSKLSGDFLKALLMGDFGKIGIDEPMFLFLVMNGIIKQRPGILFFIHRIAAVISTLLQPQPRRYS